MAANFLSRLGLGGRRGGLRDRRSGDLGRVIGTGCDCRRCSPQEEDRQKCFRVHAYRDAARPALVTVDLRRAGLPGSVLPMIEVEALTKRYGSFTAVGDLSFSVRPGEVMGLVGPNGAGKTTTLRCLCGIIPMTSGCVRIAGNDLGKDPVAAKKQFAFFPDEPRLFDYLTVRQHLAFVARLYGVEGHEELGSKLLEELELSDKADVLPGELSRGMKQKLVIACGLIHTPRVMFFDEPLTGLDPLGIRRMKDSIIRRAREGAAVVLSSHLLHLLEEVCTHVLILKQGTRVASGTLADVAAQFSNGEANVSLEEVFIRATGSESAHPL